MSKIAQELLFDSKYTLMNVLLGLSEKSAQNNEIKPILSVYDADQEKWYTIASQLALPFMLAGLGMVAAGLVLERVKELKVFKEITEIYILVPALLGLKGNLDMTLAARLSTQANIGTLDKKSEFRNLILGNLALIQLQAIVIGFLVSLVSLFISWLSQGYFNIQHALVLCSSGVSTASTASFGLSLVMILVIVLSHKCKINPDNIATPIAESLGDITTLIILATVSSYIFKIIHHHMWLPMVIIAVYITIIPLSIVITYHNEYVKDALVNGWSPVIAAMFISSMGGLILDFAVQVFHGIAVFQPVMNGVGGNLSSVRASRLSTTMHQHGKPGELFNAKKNESIVDCPNPYKVFCSRKNDSSTIRALLFMAIPGHLLFMFLIWILGANHTTFTFSFIFLYITAVLIQVAILLYIAQWMVFFVWRHQKDPDNVCIPYLTSIGDLLGTALLTCVFLVLKL